MARKLVLSYDVRVAFEYPLPGLANNSILSYEVGDALRRLTESMQGTGSIIVPESIRLEIVAD